jgi:hypothetical protein
MNTNNFDKSSTGTELELSCFFDNQRSQDDYSENFNTVEEYSQSRTNIVAFCFNGLFDVSELNKGYTVDVSSEELFKIYFKHYFNKDYSLAEPIEIEELTHDLSSEWEITPINECSIEVLLKAINCSLGYNQKEFDHFLEESGFKPTFEVLICTGYCQGDYTEVLFYKELLDYIRKELPQCEKMSNREITTYFSDDINHYLWDQPIDCRLVINGDNDDPLFLSESLKSEYIFNTDEIIEDLKKNLVHDKKDYIIEWLKDNFPKQPSAE